jgi:maleylpyruvate isomerase
MSQIADRHLRDVEVHHVDLDIGYGPSNWPEIFVTTEFAKRHTDLPGRASHHELLAWLLGRSDAPDLEPW